MRAFAYANRLALDDLRPVERPDPAPGPHDIVLRMRAVALNYRDLAIARGHYHIGVTAPLVPLSDGAGEVVAVGDAVTRFHVGDLACPIYLPDWIDGPVALTKALRRLGGPNDGVLTELMCLDEREAVKAPSHLGPVEAATLPVAAVTAWHSLFEIGTVRPGETVLVRGSGGVSVAALQLARAAGARIIVATRNEGHKERLRALGAGLVINSAVSDWAAQVVQATSGGVDTVVDVAGGAELGRSVSALRIGGTVHLVGYAAGTDASFDMFDAIRRGMTLHIATAGSRASFEALLRALEIQRTVPAVARTFRVDQIHEAMSLLAAGGLLGKIVLTF